VGSLELEEKKRKSQTGAVQILRKGLMMTREEARQTVEDWTNIERMTMDSIDVICLIEKIYESFGSCETCISFDYKQNESFGECVRYQCLKQPNGFCDEYLKDKE
jgi:hypothetical protein